ncbi:hypothetical protein B9G55_02440 [Saccharibacillus sp. O16]|nr:hypothetical protein B9G55_02440 [Saccharibacillus sp. O16]
MNGDNHEKEQAGQNGQSRAENKSMLGMGIALGVAFGLLFGLAMNNLVLGLPIGIALGVAFGAAFQNSQDSKKKEPPK